MPVRRPLLILFASLVIVPSALAVLPAKGAKFKGTDTTTAATIGKDGRTVATLTLAPKKAPAACRLKTPTLKALKITGAGTFVYKATVPSVSGKKIALIVKGTFQTDYLLSVTANYSGGGCTFAYSDTLAKR